MNNSKYNPFWIKFDGTPKGGQIPCRTIVHGPELTGEQQGEVNQNYFLFCLEKQAALGDYFVRNRTLSDGSKLRIVSQFGTDTIQVWTSGGFSECLSGLFVQCSPRGIAPEKTFETWLFTLAGKRVREGELVSRFKSGVHHNRKIFELPEESESTLEQINLDLWGANTNTWDWHRYHHFAARKNAANFCYAHGVDKYGEILPIEKRIMRGGFARGCNQHKVGDKQTWVGYTNTGDPRYVQVSNPHIHDQSGKAGYESDTSLLYPIKVFATPSLSSDPILDTEVDLDDPKEERHVYGSTVEVLDITPDGRRALLVVVGYASTTQYLGPPCREVRAIWELEFNRDFDSVSATMLKGPTGGVDENGWHNSTCNGRTHLDEHEEFVLVYEPTYTVERIYEEDREEINVTLTYGESYEMPIQEYLNKRQAIIDDLEEAEPGYASVQTKFEGEGWAPGTVVLPKLTPHRKTTSVWSYIGAYYNEETLAVEWVYFEAMCDVMMENEGEFSIAGTYTGKIVTNTEARPFHIHVGTGDPLMVPVMNDDATANGTVSASITNGVGTLSMSGGWSGDHYTASKVLFQDTSKNGMKGPYDVKYVYRARNALSVSLTGDFVDGSFLMHAGSREDFDEPEPKVRMYGNPAYPELPGVFIEDPLPLGASLANFHADYIESNESETDPPLPPVYSRPLIDLTGEHVNLLVGDFFIPHMSIYSDTGDVPEFMMSIGDSVRDGEYAIHIAPIMYAGGKVYGVQTFIGLSEWSNPTGSWMDSKIEYSKILTPRGVVGEDRYVTDVAPDVGANFPLFEDPTWRDPSRLRDNATYNPITGQVLRHTLHPAHWVGHYEKGIPIGEDFDKPMHKMVMTTEEELPFREGYGVDVNEETDTYKLRKP